MRRAARVDSNQSEIVRAFEQAGCTVRSTAALGQGFPDLVVGRAGKHGRVNLLVEIKRDEAATLTPDQVRFHREWRGQIATVRTVDDVAALLRS